MTSYPEMGSPPLSAALANGIVTLSEHVRDQVVELHGYPPEVIPLKGACQSEPGKVQS